MVPQSEFWIPGYCREGTNWAKNNKHSSIKLLLHPWKSLAVKEPSLLPTKQEELSEGGSPFGLKWTDVFSSEDCSVLQFSPESSGLNEQWGCVVSYLLPWWKQLCLMAATRQTPRSPKLSWTPNASGRWNVCGLVSFRPQLLHLLWEIFPAPLHSRIANRPVFVTGNNDHCTAYEDQFAIMY